MSTTQCQDTPGFTVENLFDTSERLDCNNLLVTCLSFVSEAQQNCCKCKPECCGQCETWDTTTCGIQEYPSWSPPSSNSWPTTTSIMPIQVLFIFFAGSSAERVFRPPVALQTSLSVCLLVFSFQLF